MTQSQSKDANSSNDKKGSLKWWQLSLLGVASIIGTGFFLGSSLAIKTSGPSILISFLLAALATYIVFNALARMTADDPQKGSFRSYAKKAFGRWAGFSNGWVYWASEMLIMGSQLTALGLFTRFWFDNFPLWLLTLIYGVLGIIVILAGVSSFKKVENVLAILKIAAIFMFIIIAALALFGVIDGEKEVSIKKTYSEIFPNGFKGFWTALIYAFYAFGGIEVMGIMASDLKEPKDAPKSGKIMLILLTTIYLLSLGLAITLLSWDKFSTKQSPFMTALEGYNLPFVPHVFNAVLIIGGFSTMVAALYGVTNMIVTLSEDGDAPKVFQTTKGKKKLPIAALLLTVGGLIVSIVVSLLLPDKIYEYLTTAAGLMLLYTWLFILFSFKRVMKKLTATDKFLRILGILLILLAISGTMFEKVSRIGFFVSFAFLGVIGIVTLIMRKKWKKEEATHKG
ncbi:amino acid permease [Bacillus suaedaesalsae]|uniref:Amino acid permease n=1 Tax=Bacillus suaedaesalsae TaxID=2810349 RepID=A0ABS2DMU4_9BACI|nr:amino acid permease [Bacillus suaedaesalsae]MBM6619802.1 amino acid permease [Bacillus suaedaesalsae]